MTRQRVRGVLVLAVVGTVLGTLAAADDDLLAHWIFESKQLSGNVLQPVAGKTPLPWEGGVALSEMESPQALILDGTRSLSLSPEARKPILPKTAFSVVVWIRVDAVTPWGGIVSALQDNGNAEKGWLLGMHEGRFTFALATKGADDGDGKLTYLDAESKFTAGKWHHVVATYDGALQRLFVDGRRERESKVQSGDILYPDRFAFEIGAYQDDDERYPITGRLREVKLLHRALSEKEVAADFEGTRLPYPKEPVRIAPETTGASQPFTDPVRAGGSAGVVAPTRQVLQPVGDSVTFPGRPVDLVAAPNGRWVYVKDNRGLVVLDRRTWRVEQELKFDAGGGSMHGLAVSPDGKRVWATTAQDRLFEAAVSEDGRLRWQRSILLRGPDGKGNSHPCGVCLVPGEETLLVCLSRNNSLGVVDLKAGKLVREVPVSVAPFDVVVKADGKTAFVSNWGGRRPGKDDKTAPSSGTPVLVDERGVAKSGTVGKVDLVAGKQVAEVATGLHPSDLLLHEASERLFVANANSDTVTVLDAATFREVETIDARPDPALAFGSASNALALSQDGRTLYVANGGNNAVAIIALAAKAGEKSQRAGFLPTAWYPGALALDGDDLFIANVKGFGSRGEMPGRPGRSVYSYQGVVTRTAARPDAEKLADLTDQVKAATRVPQMLRAWEKAQTGAAPLPVPRRAGEPSVFEHVVYIIKENRTYDQVFGDIKEGRGDPKLCIYGRDVTPNHHALAGEFVLLDNFYCNGVLSADGHAWAVEGNATDYLEKTFGGFTRSYPFGDDPLSYSSSGFLWDHVLLHGLSFRNYGEFDYAEPIPANATFKEVHDDFIKTTKKIRFRQVIGVEPLRKYTCPDYPGWNMKIPDVLRADVFLKELAAAEKSGSWPNLMVLVLPQDHTSGLSPGMPTPAAHMADNDLALGRIVEGISKSKFWPKTCVFVIEDDPQDGFDHVDGHRSLCLVASPYTRRKVVVSEFYNQTSVLHTIQRILGCPPMNQMVAMSPVMTSCFTEKPDLTPFTARPANVPLDRLNFTKSELRGRELYWAEKSEALDMSKPDLADEDTLNRILWHAARGVEAEYPAAHAGAHGRGLKGRGLKLER